MPFRRLNHKEHNKSWEEIIYIKYDFTSNIVSFTFLALSDDEILYEKKKTRLWLFLLVRNENDQKDIIFYPILQVVTNK